MGRRTLRAPRKKPSDRPSTFFLIALAVGVVIVVAMYVLLWSRPMKVEPKPGKKLDVHDSPLDPLHLRARHWIVREGTSNRLPTDAPCPMPHDREP